MLRILFCIIISLIPIKLYASEEDTIVLPLNDWGSQRILTKLVGNKIKQLGYQVEYLPITSTLQLGALRKGVVHLQIELWQSHDDGDYFQAFAKGFIDDLGTHQAFGREDWWYPTYVEQYCPGLPNWQALKDCSAIFASETSQHKGVFYTGPWNYRDADLIRALELNFAIERLENAEQIWRRLQLAYEKKQPIIILNWTPNWLDVRVEGRFIEFPAYEKDCEKDPAWGVNKNMLYDCGNPKVTLIKKAAWPGLKDRWPCIYQLVKKINFTSEMIAQASSLSGPESQFQQVVMDEWLNKFKEENQPWLDHQCTSL